MGLELIIIRVVISANINSTIANILSPNLSLYDLQKPIYDIPILRAIARDKIADFAVFPQLWRGWHSELL